jgi:small subunit ribosomal protein S8e
MTKLGPTRIHLVRGRGGNMKYRALRLENGNFSWGTENVTKKTRVMDVVYNASNNELVRTKTIVKNAVVLVDATPFRQYYETHYHTRVVKKQGAEDGTKYTREEIKAEAGAKAVSELTKKKYAERQAALTKTVDPKIEEQLVTGRLLAVISSRPGQSGRADGYILEGPELEFYQRKIAQKKSGKAAK